MSTLFLKKLKDTVELTPGDEAIIMDHLSVKKFRRKQYLLQAGDICRSLVFVEHGTLRAYSTDDKGLEHIIQFALEGWTISDMYSFMTGEPSVYSIDALEDTEVVVVTKTGWEIMQKLVPGYELYVRGQLTGAYSAMQKRITSLISLSPEERYLSFISLYPDIVQRVPQHMVASYLGLSPETLSRVRKRLATGKS